MAGKKGYVVGYGKPPKHSQFKKGISGNKKGRPKGVKNFETIIQEEMNRKVPISENGQRRMVTKFEATVKQLANKAAMGDPKSIQLIMNLSRQFEDSKPFAPSQQPQVPKLITLRIFEKDPTTGERKLVETVTRERDK